MVRINEFGEEISEDGLTEIAKRIRKLSPEKIDEIFYLCKFIIQDDREPEFKAIRQYDIDEIKKSLNSAREKIWHLIAETEFSQFKKNLEKVENRK